MSAVKTVVACLCGGTMIMSSSGVASPIDDMVAVFWRVHNRDGCGSTDAATAAKARRRG